MNIRCPECSTTFRVDPSRVPPAGVRARCSRCSATFTITREQAEAALQPAAAAAAAPATAPTPMPAPPAPTMPAPPAPTMSPPQPQGRPQPPSPAPTAAPVTPPRPSWGSPATPPPAPARPAPAPPPEQRTPVFGSRDPNSRAQRIARALVSDIVAYHPKRRDACLEAGTLRTEFREEIMKSWEEYVAQVGLEMAKSTPYFRDALNAILAKGQNVF